MELLHSTLVPEAFRGGWASASSKVSLFCFALHVAAEPNDREYADFALFLEADVDDTTKDTITELYLKKGRTVKIQLVSRGQVEFEVHQLKDAMRFQEKIFSIALGQKTEQDLQPNWDPSHLYLILPLLPYTRIPVLVDWKCVRSVLTEVVPGSLSPFQAPREDHTDHKNQSKSCSFVQMANGPASLDEVVNSLVETIHDGKQYIIVRDMDSHSSFGDDQSGLGYKLDLLHPKQLRLKAKPLKKMTDNLLLGKTKTGPDKQSGSVATEEFFIKLRPERCRLEVLGFSSQVVNTVSLIPSFMHRVEKFLLATQLQKELEAAFSEAAKVSPKTVLQALTTARCQESLSLERLEFFGDSFLKFAVSKRLFIVFDKAREGELTEMRKHEISNSSLHERGVAHKLTMYINDEHFNPLQWSAPGRPGRAHCDASNRAVIHASQLIGDASNPNQVKCSEGHRSLQKKAVADVVEAFIGAHLVEGGSEAALAFMEWVGISVYFDENLISEASTRCAGDIRFVQGKDLSELEKILGYSFQNKAILVVALTHGSLQVPSQYCFQRLEFLGDAVLDYLITRHLYENLPHFPPGNLTDLRIASARNECYAEVAVRHHLHNFLLHKCTSFTEAIKKFALSRETDEPFYGWETDKSPDVLGDLVESLAGAVLVDTAFDIEKVWSVFEPLLQPIVCPAKLRLHPVRELDELCKKIKFQNEYTVTSEGAQRVVKYTVHTGKKTLVSQAEKHDTRSAERLAAYEMLTQLKNLGWQHQYNDLTAALISQGRMEPLGQVADVCNLGQMGDELKSQDATNINLQNISEKIAGGLSQESSREISQENLVERCSGGDQQDHAEMHVVSNSIAGLELLEMSRSAYSGSLECLTTSNSPKSVGAEHGARPCEVPNFDESYGEAPTDLRDLTEKIHVDESYQNFSYYEALSCKPYNYDYVTDGIITPEASFVKQQDPSTSNTPLDSSHFEPAVYEDGNVDSMDLSDDVQLLIDALVGHPGLKHGTVGAGVAATTGNLKEEIFKGGTQNLHAVNGFLNREYTLSSSSHEKNVSGSSVHSNSFDGNVGRPRGDLHELCDKYRWTKPKYELCPGYPEGPPHARRFAYFVGVSCWLSKPGSTDDYDLCDIECKGEPMNNKPRAMDSAASCAIAWLQENFVSGRTPVQAPRLPLTSPSLHHPNILLS